MPKPPRTPRPAKSVPAEVSPGAPVSAGQVLAGPAAGKRALTITSLNVNGLRAAEKRGFSQWLSGHRPDVLLLQEVRCLPEEVPPTITALPGYSATWNCAVKRGYAGTSVWTRAGQEATVLKGVGHTRGDEEGRVVGVRLPDVDVYSVYLPSGSAGPERQAWKMDFLAHFGPWMKRILESGRPAIIGGDFNMAHTPKDIKNAKSNEKNSGFLPEERAWLDGLYRSGWRDLFRERHPERVSYSWWSARGAARANDVGWRIDYLVGTPGIHVEDADIHREPALSDHAPVTVTVRV